MHVRNWQGSGSRGRLAVCCLGNRRPSPSYKMTLRIAWEQVPGRSQNSGLNFFKMMGVHLSGPSFQRQVVLDFDQRLIS